MLILQYKVSFTNDRLGRCFRFVYIYACIAVRFSVNKDLYTKYCRNVEVGVITCRVLSSKNGPDEIIMCDAPKSVINLFYRRGTARRAMSTAADAQL